MAAFVSVEDYLAYFDIDEPSAAEYMRAELDLDAACDAVRDHIHQQIDLVEDDTIILFGTDTRALILPGFPVVAVTSVTIDGEALVVDDDWTLDGAGVLWRVAPSYWPRGEQYEVVYDHGYAPADIPAIFKVAALQLTHAAATAASGVRSESIADYSVTYNDSSSASESIILGALNRRVVRKVPTP